VATDDEGEMVFFWGGRVVLRARCAACGWSRNRLAAHTPLNTSQNKAPTLLNPPPHPHTHPNPPPIPTTQVVVRWT